MIAMIVGHRNDWFWENDQSDWSRGNDNPCGRASRAESNIRGSRRGQLDQLALNLQHCVQTNIKDQSTAVHWSAGFGLGVIHKCHLLAALLRSPTMFHWTFSAGQPARQREVRKLWNAHKIKIPCMNCRFFLLLMIKLDDDDDRRVMMARCGWNRWLHPPMALPAAIIKMRLRYGSH